MTKADLRLHASIRQETGKQVERIRERGKVPAVLYGHKVKPVSLALDASVFEKIYQAAGESTLVDLVVGEAEPVKVLIQDRQCDPVSSHCIHVDFYQVNMKEKIHAHIHLKFINEAPAVKTFSGILVTSLDEVEVKCLPLDLVHEIEVDLSSLKTFDDIIHVKDLTIPAGLEVLNVPDDVVALVQEPREEEASTAAAPEAVAAVPTVAEAKAAAEGAESAPEEK